MFIFGDRVVYSTLVLKYKERVTSILNANGTYVTGSYYRSDPEYKDGLYTKLNKRLLYFG